MKLIEALQKNLSFKYEHCYYVHVFGNQYSCFTGDFECIEILKQKLDGDFLITNPEVKLIDGPVIGYARLTTGGVLKYSVTERVIGTAIRPVGEDILIDLIGQNR